MLQMCNQYKKYDRREGAHSSIQEGETTTAFATLGDVVVSFPSDGVGCAGYDAGRSVDVDSEDLGSEDGE